MINKKTGRAAARTDDGEFVIIELLGDYVLSYGDEVCHHDFTSMGGNKYLNKSTGEWMDVYVQDLCGTMALAKEKCFS